MYKNPLNTRYFSRNTKRFLQIGFYQKPDVVMQMLRHVATGGYGVHVNIENGWSFAVIPNQPK